MEQSMENAILKELREFRTETNKKFDDVNERLDETNKRIDVVNERLDETNKRIDDVNERLDETNKRIDDVSERLDETNKRIDDVNERLDETNRRIDDVDERLGETNRRVTNLEEGRIKDRRDILDILDTMQKSISNQFTEMREYMDAKFEKISALQRVNDTEHDEFKKLLYAHNKRLDFHSARLEYLEKWKEDLGMGEYTAV